MRDSYSVLKTMGGRPPALEGKLNSADVPLKPVFHGKEEPAVAPLIAETRRRIVGDLLV